MHTNDSSRADADRLDTARRLGREHGRAGTVPFGQPGGAYPESGKTGAPSYTEYVYWDAGSGRLMDALSETGDTTQDNYAVRTAGSGILRRIRPGTGNRPSRLRLKNKEAPSARRRSPAAAVPSPPGPATF